jgi:hypothetical protein
VSCYSNCFYAIVGIRRNHAFSERRLLCVGLVDSNAAGRAREEESRDAECRCLTRDQQTDRGVSVAKDHLNIVIGTQRVSERADMRRDPRDRSHEGNRLIDDVSAVIKMNSPEILGVTGLPPIAGGDGAQALEPRFQPVERAEYSLVSYPAESEEVGVPSPILEGMYLHACCCRRLKHDLRHLG